MVSELNFQISWNLDPNGLANKKRCFHMLPVIEFQDAYQSNFILCLVLDCFTLGPCSYLDLLKIIRYWEFQKILVISFEQNHFKIQVGVADPFFELSSNFQEIS